MVWVAGCACVCSSCVGGVGGWDGCVCGWCGCANWCVSVWWYVYARIVGVDAVAGVCDACVVCAGLQLCVCCMKVFSAGRECRAANACCACVVWCVACDLCVQRAC